MAFFAGLFLWNVLLGADVTDVAELLPVQVLTISQEKGKVTVETDIGVKGSRENLHRAMDQAELRSSGKLFLETAEQIVLVQPTEDLVQQAAEETRLRPAAKVYQAAKKPEPKERVPYLQAHGEGVRLAEVKARLLRGEDVELPTVLQPEKGETDGTDERDAMESLGAFCGIGAVSHGTGGNRPSVDWVGRSCRMVPDPVAVSIGAGTDMG